MPWRLIGLIVILALFLIFSGFNVHKVTINFGPFPLADIPLFVIIIFSYILGAITAIPFTIITSYKKKKKKLKKEKKAESNEPPQITGPADQTPVPEKNTQETKKKRKTKKK